jgi:phage-related protein
MFLGQLGVSRELVKMLTQDVGGLRDAYRQMYAAAGIDAQKAAEASRGFVNKVNSIKTVFGLLAKSVASAFIVKMQGSLISLRKSLVENFTKVSRVFQTILGVLLRVAGAFGALAMRLMQWIGGIVEWFGKLDTGTQNLILAALGFAAAWKFLNLSFLATPLGMLIAGLAAVVALVDDFQTYMEGGESLIDWGPWAGQIMAVVDALRPLMDALGQLWDMLKGPLMEGFRNFGQDAMAILGALLGAVASFIMAVVQLFQGDFAGALNSVLNIFQRLMDIVNVVAGRIGEFLSSSWGAVKSLFGGGPNPERPASPVLGPTPALAAAAAAGNTSNVNLQSNTTINVDGAGDPAAVGRTVGGHQGRVNADLVRHARGAAR